MWLFSPVPAHGKSWRGLEGGLLVRISGEPAIPEEGPEPEKGDLLPSHGFLGLPW